LPLRHRVISRCLILDTRGGSSRSHQHPSLPLSSCSSSRASVGPERAHGLFNQLADAEPLATGPARPKRDAPELLGVLCSDNRRGAIRGDDRRSIGRCQGCYDLSSPPRGANNSGLMLNGQAFQLPPLVPRTSDFSFTFRARGALVRAKREPNLTSSGARGPRGLGPATVPPAPPAEPESDRHVRDRATTLEFE